VPRLEQRVGPLAGGMAQQTAATHGSDQLRPLFDFRIWPNSDVRVLVREVRCRRQTGHSPSSIGTPVSDRTRLRRLRECQCLADLQLEQRRSVEGKIARTRAPRLSEIPDLLDHQPDRPDFYFGCRPRRLWGDRCSKTGAPMLRATMN
jgi:hypothetical protein